MNESDVRERDKLENDLNTALLKSCDDTCVQLNYRPRLFQRILEEFGPTKAVKMLLSTELPSEGFTTLLLQQRLDLSVEHIILTGKWKVLFSDSILAKARARINVPFHKYREWDCDSDD